MALSPLTQVHLRGITGEGIACLTERLSMDNLPDRPYHSSPFLCWQLRVYLGTPPSTENAAREHGGVERHDEGFT